MSNFGSFLYHSGTLYGATIGVNSVSPSTGPSTGGNAFVLSGTGLSLGSFDDSFDGLVLNPALWTDQSSGTGVVSTGATHLTLSTGATPGSYACIEGVPIFNSFQAEVSVTIPRISKYPGSDVRFADFSIYIDANNYASMAIVVGSTSSDITLQCTTVVGGTTMYTYEADWTTGVSTLRLLRWNGEVYFIANGSVICQTSSFLNSNAQFRISAYNGSASYDVTGVTVNSYSSKPYVVFDNTPVWDTVIVSPTRVRGTVPPSIDAFHNSAGYAGLVDVYFVSITSDHISNAYEYYFLKSLVLVDNQQDDLVLSIVDDVSVRTPSDVRRGL